jgi:hypothetical protein
MRNQPSFLHEIIELSGSPYEIGFQRGKMFKERLQRDMEKLTFGNPYFHDRWPKPEDYNQDTIKKRAPGLYKDWEKALKKTPEWLREECQGQADGASVPYEKMILAGSWFPLIMPVKGGTGSPASPEDDCNGFVAYGKATADGKPLVGGNGETDHESLRHMAIIRYKNNDYNNFVLQSKGPHYPGTQCGINEKGVCLFGSGVSIKPEIFGDYGYRGIIRRIVLQEANNIDEAIDLFKQGPLMGGQHIYLADKKRAVHIEYAGRNIAVIDPENGFDAGASPYFSTPKTQEWCNVISDNTDPNYGYHVAKARGQFRMERWHELFEMHKPLTIEKMPTLLGDHGGRGTGVVQEHIEGACYQGSDYTICVHGKRSRGTGGTGGTATSFHSSSFGNISQPDKLKFWVAFGNSCEAGFVPFTPPK